MRKLLLVLILLPLTPAAAAALPESLVLVATPQLVHPLYGRSVLVVTSFGRGQHLGFIVNRPTRFKLGDLFPQHGPSQKVVHPVFLGGPFDVQLGAWYVLDADASVALREPRGMWEELMLREQRMSSMRKTATSP